jgi:hypothetical protein
VERPALPRASRLLAVLVLRDSVQQITATMVPVPAWPGLPW